MSKTLTSPDTHNNGCVRRSLSNNIKCVTCSKYEKIRKVTNDEVAALYLTTFNSIRFGNTTLSKARAVNEATT